MKSDLEKELDEVVDGLKLSGLVIVYSLTRYDEGADGKGYRDSTRISLPEGVDPDATVRSIIDGDADVTDRAFGTLDALLEKLRDEGWSVLFGYGGRDYVNTTSEWKPIISLRHASCEHQRLDQVRNILVAWSNARHASQLVWKD